jgi:hypothetical protein
LRLLAWSARWPGHLSEVAYNPSAQRASEITA